MRNYNFCFTHFDLDFNFDNMIKDNVVFCIWQLEECPSTKRQHQQGYIEFKNKVSIKSAKKIMAVNTSKLLVAKGNAEQNINYCSKSVSKIKGPFVYGEPKKQGQDTSLKVYIERLKNESIDKLAIDMPETYVKHFAGLNKLKFIYLKDQTKSFRSIKTNILWGDAGSGKTKHVHDSHSDVYTLNNLDNKIWFDGYIGQKCLLIEELTNWIPFTFLLKLMDGYQLQLPIKNGFTYANWEWIYITSNINPYFFYNHFDNCDKNAFFRRVNNIIEFKFKIDGNKNLFDHIMSNVFKDTIEIPYNTSKSLKCPDKNINIDAENLDKVPVIIDHINIFNN